MNPLDFGGSWRAHRRKAAARHRSNHGVDEPKRSEGSTFFLAVVGVEHKSCKKCAQQVMSKVAFEMLDVNKEGALGKKQADAAS